MICNIIDNREWKYRWKKINAIIEATWHDNSCQDTDIAKSAPDDIEVTYDQREGISLSEAVAWASAEPCQVTLYVYDDGKGTN